MVAGAKDANPCSFSFTKSLSENVDTTESTETCKSWIVPSSSAGDTTQVSSVSVHLVQTKEVSPALTKVLEQSASNPLPVICTRVWPLFEMLLGTNESRMV